MRKFLACMLVCILFLSVPAGVVATSGGNVTSFSAMSPNECLDFIITQGVTIPYEFQDDEDLGAYVKQIIMYVEQTPNIEFAINHSVTLKFANNIRDAVNTYLGTNNTRAITAESDYTLQYSTVVGPWQDYYLNYNCYGYALNRTTSKIEPGHLSKSDWTSDLSITETATLVINDLKALGNSCVRRTTFRPSYSSLASDEKAICVRIGGKDFHVMKLVSDGWYHKPGATAVLKLKDKPAAITPWTNEYSKYNIAYPPTLEYSGSIYYIIYNQHHTYEQGAYTGNNYHSGSKHYAEYEYECACGVSYTTYVSYNCTGNPCITPNAVIDEVFTA